MICGKMSSAVASVNLLVNTLSTFYSICLQMDIFQNTQKVFKKKVQLLCLCVNATWNDDISIFVCALFASSFTVGSTCASICSTASSEMCRIKGYEISLYKCKEVDTQPCFSATSAQNTLPFQLCRLYFHILFISTGQ